MMANAGLYGIDYDAFNSPWTGIAAMIFYQADMDLRTLNGQEKAYRHSCLVDRWEILNFLRSEWAEYLAWCLGIGQDELERYAEAATT